jgi:hypothetical protein
MLRKSRVRIDLLALLLAAMVGCAQPAMGQEQRLEISDVQFQSEGENVVGKLYRLKELKAPAPATAKRGSK